MKQSIINARLIDPASNIDGVQDLHIEDGKIVALGSSPSGFSSDDVTVIDASGQWLLPGLVDIGVRLREPGADHKANIASETYAAACSGITTLCCFPEPDASINNAATVNLMNEINQRSCKSHLEIVGNLTQDLNGEALSNMASLQKANCVGVSNGWQPFKSPQVLRTAMEYAASHGLTVFVYPIEHSLMNNGCAHESHISSRLGLPSIPVAAETAALGQIIALVEDTQASVHICRLSTASGVKLIEYAKKQGLPITADVAIHQLFLTDMDICDYNPFCHTIPPLRSERDRNALREAVANGTIDVICSDHQPHDIDAKLAPFQNTEPGISSLETFLFLSMRLVEDDVLTLSQAVAAMTSNPANILGIPAGTLQEGENANLFLFDPNDWWELVAEKMKSAGKNTPFAGWGFNGQVSKTFLAGDLVFDREH